MPKKCNCILSVLLLAILFAVAFHYNFYANGREIVGTFSTGNNISNDDLYITLGQFTRNYTQTVKRAADNKRRYAPGEGSIPPVLLSGVSKGAPLWHTTLLAKCSVLYALSALLRKCGCHRGGQGHLKQQENRTVIAWRGAASAGLVSPADRAYMKAPVPCPTPDFGTKCPELVATLTKKQTDFSLKIEMGGKPF